MGRMDPTEPQYDPDELDEAKKAEWVLASSSLLFLRRTTQIHTIVRETPRRAPREVEVAISPREVEVAISPDLRHMRHGSTA